MANVNVLKSNKRHLKTLLTVVTLFLTAPTAKTITFEHDSLTADVKH